MPRGYIQYHIIEIFAPGSEVIEVMEFVRFCVSLFVLY